LSSTASEGGNAFAVDGHVQRRRFDRLELRIPVNGPELAVFWWCGPPQFCRKDAVNGTSLRLPLDDLLALTIAPSVASDGSVPSISGYRSLMDRDAVLTLGGRRIYLSGDTGITPEMRALTNIDVALPCMNRPFTTTVADATNTVRAFLPKGVYPCRYRDQERFDRQCRYVQAATGNRHRRRGPVEELALNGMVSTGAAWAGLARESRNASLRA
jgi:hypothetical protein